MEEPRDELSLLEAALPAKSLGRGGFFGRRTGLLVMGLVLFGVILLPGGTGAMEIGQGVAWVVGSLFHILVGLVGQLLLLLVGALIWIAQYNGFVDSTAVTTGWVIVRDIANMFFIVALLIIAFGTILGFSTYHYSGTLPRLVIMAVVVNFSRTICGLIIDFSQIVMLTFVNGFKEAAGGNFINSFGLANLLQVSPSENPDVEEDLLWGVTLSLILAFLLVAIASGVVVIMIAVLVVRIVYLWLLVVLSPLAFVASATPIQKASGFYGKWWELFNKQVMVGPLMAFFLWLALISVNDAGGQVFAGASATTDTLGGTAASSFTQHDVAGTIQKFIISIGMLLGGVSLAQEMSGTAVGAGKNILKGAGRFAGRASKWAARGAYNVSGADRAVDRVKEKAYTLGGKTRIPLASSYFRKQAALQRKTIASKSAADSEAAGYLSNKELMAEIKGPALSNEARGRKKAAIKEQLKRADDPTSGVKFKTKDEYHALRKEAERLGDATYDSSMKTDFSDFAKKNTRYIVDDNAKGEERQNQLDFFNAVWKGRSSKGITDASEKDYTPEGMMQARAEALNNAYSNMSAAQADAMMGKKGLDFSDEERKEFEGLSMTKNKEKQRRLEMIRKKQNGLKTLPKNFEYLSDQERREQLKSADQAKVRKMGVEKVATIDPKEFRKDQDLALNVGKGLESEDIKRLPQEIGDEVRKALLGAGNDQKFLEAGGKLEAVIPGFDPKNGNMADDAGRQRLNQWMSKGPVSDRVGLVQPELLTKNGGNNDLAIAAAGKLSAAGLQKMAEGKNQAQAAAMTEALSHLSKIPDGAAGTPLAAAQANARNIMKEAERKGSPLQASLQGMRFSNRVDRKIDVTLRTVGGAADKAPGATDKAIGDALAGVGKAADNIPGNVDRAVQRSLLRAARRAQSLGGRIGARRRLF